MKGIECWAVMSLVYLTTIFVSQGVERKQEQNRLVGIVSIAASSPPKNLGKEKAMYHIPIVPSTYDQATVKRIEDQLV